MPKTDIDRRLRRNGWGLLVFVGVCVALMVVFGVLGVSCGSRLNLSWGRRPLQPIPVPMASCSYLQRVHDTADAAGRTSGTATNNTDPRTWPRRALIVAQKLAAFDQALEAAAAHTPTPIASKLTTVHDQVGVAAVQLSQGRSGRDWSARTFGSVVTGYAALSDASDLTGTACGFTVAPDASVFLNTTNHPLP